MALPIPQIKRRAFSEAQYAAGIAAGLAPALAQVVAARVDATVDVARIINPKLAYLDAPTQLKDIMQASTRIVQAIQAGEIIALETDHDCDGQTSHAVLHEALVRHFGHPAEKVLSFIGHRMVEGYGLSDALATRILQHPIRPDVVITADNGSSDETRIARLKEAGIVTIVTDHHALPSEGPPPSALAVINPTRHDCAYPDKAIAGCMVAWLFMAQVRAQLIEVGHLPSNAPAIGDLLDFVAVGTVADCVSLGHSINNRAVVRYGMHLIKQQKRPCWRAIMPLCRGPLTSEDLGFTIGPLLNSDGRLSDALGSVSFLLAQNDAQAQEWVTHLSAQNTERKAIQRRLTESAQAQALQAVTAGRWGLALMLEDGHAGVHGISASRIKDAFGRPTVLFSHKQGQPDLISGSARSIDNFHMREALAAVVALMPDDIVAFGGHQGAAGITLKAKALRAFEAAFDAHCQAVLTAADIGPVVWTDGILPKGAYQVEFVHELYRQLEPFGRGFEAPVFEGQGRIQEIRPVGDGTHARLVIQGKDYRMNAIWFGATGPGEPLPVGGGDTIQFVYRMALNHYQGQVSLNPQIVCALPLTAKDEFVI